MIHSKEDKQAIDLLEFKTARVEVDGVLRYATPLLWRKNFPLFQALLEAVMPQIRGLEKCLLRAPDSSDAYEADIRKLETVGTISKLPVFDSRPGGEMCYIPHHMMQHNGKNQIVFDCSFQYKGLCLNKALLPG